VSKSDRNMAWGYWSATVVTDKGRSPRKQSSSASSSRLSSNFQRRSSFRDPLSLSSSREFTLHSVPGPSNHTHHAPSVASVVQNHAAECPVAIAAAAEAGAGPSLTPHYQQLHLHHIQAASAPVSPSPTPAPTRENSPVPSPGHTSEDEVEILLDEGNFFVNLSV
jgi:hypothetical protein